MVRDAGFESESGKSKRSRTVHNQAVFVRGYRTLLEITREHFIPAHEPFAVRTCQGNIRSVDMLQDPLIPVPT
jgi:hypothetical protein